jgi:alkanesulfonate monooxygenase SsuD/methylene tetrahydromethanopterin reductase-like flavin-dependent oxidoreductase (luciferase family)
MRRARRPISIESAPPLAAKRRAPSSCGATSTSASRRPRRKQYCSALSQGYRGIPAEALIAGSVDEVAAKFRTFEKIGYTDILVRHLTNDQPKVLGSLERLATVRAALSQP